MEPSHDFQIVRQEQTGPKTRALAKADAGANPFKIVIVRDIWLTEHSLHRAWDGLRTAGFPKMLAPSRVLRTVGQPVTY